VPNPYEEVSLSNPITASLYSFRAFDNLSAACACSVGPISVTFNVYRNGVLEQTNPTTSTCGTFTATFRYLY
jgi:hypothetical protein